MTADIVSDNSAETSAGIPLSEGKFAVTYGYVACSTDGSFGDSGIEFGTSFTLSYSFVVTAEDTSSIPRNR